MPDQDPNQPLADTSSFEEVSAIEVAIAQNNLPAVRVILDHDPSAIDQRFPDNANLSPLMWACRRRRTSIVEELLQRGADVNARNGDDGNFALWFTANGNAALGADTDAVDIARLLVGYNADVNLAGEFGQTALHQAALWNQTLTAAFLIESGAQVDAKTNSGETPLMLADKYGFAEVAQVLVQTPRTKKVRNGCSF